MSIRFKCSTCSREIEARNEQAGNRVLCPGCNATITVPRPPEGVGARSRRPPMPRVSSKLAVVGLCLISLLIGISIGRTLKRGHTDPAKDTVAARTPESEPTPTTTEESFVPTQGDVWHMSVADWRSFSRSNGLIELPGQSDPNLLMLSNTGTNDGLRVNVSFRRGRLIEIRIWDRAGNESKALTLCQKLEPTLPSLLNILRDRQRAHPREQGNSQRIRSTEFACTWSEPCTVRIRYIGTMADHTRLARVRLDVIRMLLAWNQYGSTAGQEDAKASPAVRKDRLKAKFAGLAEKFRSVHLLDEGSEHTDKPDAEFPIGIPAEWPDITKARLLTVTRRCELVFQRAERDLDAGSLRSRPFEDMAGILAEDGKRAADDAFGEMVQLSDHEAVCVLPPDVKRSWDELSLKAPGAITTAPGK